MNAILGMAALLLDSELTGPQREYASAITTAGTALLTIVNDLLDIAKIERGELGFEEQRVDVRALIATAAEKAAKPAQRKGLRFEVTVGPAVPISSIADPKRLTRVIDGLLDNAVKFTDTGWVAMKIDQDGEFLRVQVQDTGVGIDESSFSRLFQPFHQEDGARTRRVGGLGTGLAIAKSIVEGLGGSIHVESKLGLGSTFEASLRARPWIEGEASSRVDMAAALAAPKKAAFAESRLTDTKSLKVLVAEDDDTNAMLVSALLRKLGHTMLRARNGAEAVAKASSEFFDLILMDVQMPEVDGLEATARIRATEAEGGRHIPIVALTANAMKGDKELCLTSGMDHYLSKPVTVATLASMLGQLRKG